MRKYFGYTELLEDLLMLLQKHKGKAELVSIGKSLKGRRIPALKAGKGSKNLLVVGSVHGREYVSSAFIMRSLQDLLENNCALDKCLWMVPMLNPDGVEIALGRELPLVHVKDFDPEFFKNNADNINLNANFPFCFHRVPKSRQGGRLPASEPEVKALINLCEKVCFDSAISIHARGNCVFWRDMGNGRIKGDFELAKSLEQNCGFELVVPTQNAADYSGGFENWFRFRYKKPALCVELVKDEKISFEDMIRSFEDAVIWDKTGNLFDTYINF